MPTMKDIARMAKVSTSTVSHVINNSRFVSDEIREKVMVAVNELNYTPSALARSLKMKETRTLGMLVTASDNPFFAEVLRSVENYCNANSYNLIVSYTDGDNQRLERNLQALIQKQIDGLLLMCSESHWHISDNLSLRLQLPMVMMDWWPTELNADKIYEDSEYGGHLATTTLIEQGHRDIAIITGNLKKSIAKKRLQGYQTALSQAGIPVVDDYIYEGHFSCESGLAGMNYLLQLPHPPTAVFACSDTIAIGAYQSCWKANLHVGEDISIIGYDNINLSQYLAPPLTTINQPVEELAQVAVETLLQRIKAPATDYQILMVKPELVQRSSIAILK